LYRRLASKEDALQLTEELDPYVKTMRERTISHSEVWRLFESSRKRLVIDDQSDRLTETVAQIVSYLPPAAVKNADIDGYIYNIVRKALSEVVGDEGFSSGHPDMPEFRFEVDEVDAILAYLESIQEEGRNAQPSAR
jgi:hypothetical protein